MEIRIGTFSRDAYREARRRWDAVAKPLGSLGLLEEDIARAAGAQGTADVRLDPRLALVFCGDHGVTAQGVTQSDSDVTAKVAESVVRGESNVCLMAQAAGCEVLAVDMGMKRRVPGALDRRLGEGTADFTRGPAMTREQAERGILAGMETVRDAAARGVRVIAVGEMGIGNTTAAAAVAAALLGREPEAFVGRGAGLSDAGLARKRAAVEAALRVNRPDPADGLGVLAAVGGFDLAGMAGAFLGGAACGVVTVVDGSVSAAAALAAARICPGAADFMLASHLARAPGAAAMLEALGLRPVIHAEMALGEGTGAVCLLPLLDMALCVYAGPHTFGSLGIEAYTPQGEGERG